MVRFPKQKFYKLISVVFLASIFILIGASPNLSTRYFDRVVARTVELTTGTYIGSSTIFTPTAAQIITPATEIYFVHATTGITIQLGACGSNGQDVRFVSLDAFTFGISNTANTLTPSGADITADQFDVIDFTCVFTRWAKTGETNNE